MAAAGIDDFTSPQEKDLVDDGRERTPPLGSTFPEGSRQKPGAAFSLNDTLLKTLFPMYFSFVRT